MNSQVRIGLTVLAVYRLAALISQEEGPYLGLWRPKGMGLFERIRMALGAFDYAENGQPQTNAARGISCPLCVGLYLSVLGMVFLLRPSAAGDVVVAVFGIAGGQVFLESLVSKKK